ncbi:hypothetical protein L0V05_00780 [Tabrizicola sp. J26]|uniref:hypothetical protein n=1 Tax=Alitabrizicola rongguiensis TaxID=2909234 RepID=UPI001F216F75|nr:hypothetical protein [Tabrizicola rongguiensis]MCF1707339.1 hypothetical protein [Tabrizicola rongguiensis]
MRKLLISLAVVTSIAGCVNSTPPQGDPQDDNYRRAIASDAYGIGNGCASCTTSQQNNLDFARSNVNPGRANYGGAIGAGGGLRGGGGGLGGGGGGGRGR